MSAQPLENSLNDVFGKQAPALPTNARRAIAQYLPWVTLILGIISLWTAYVVWHWAHIANTFVDYANSLSAAYGGPQVASTRLTVGIWLGIAVLAVEALLYIAAFPGLKARKKSAWNLLYYALLINIVYGVVIMFTAYGGIGNLFGTLIGSAIGFYFLFQIRDRYKA